MPKLITLYSLWATGKYPKRRSPVKQPDSTVRSTVRLLEVEKVWKFGNESCVYLSTTLTRQRPEHSIEIPQPLQHRMQDDIEIGNPDACREDKHKVTPNKVFSP